MDRDAFVRRIMERGEPWDIAVVGGGATGVGIAVDAASRDEAWEQRQLAAFHEVAAHFLPPL